MSNGLFSTHTALPARSRMSRNSPKARVAQAAEEIGCVDAGIGEAGKRADFHAAGNGVLGEEAAAGVEDIRLRRAAQRRMRVEQPAQQRRAAARKAENHHAVICSGCHQGRNCRCRCAACQATVDARSCPRVRSSHPEPRAVNYGPGNPCDRVVRCHRCSATNVHTPSTAANGSAPCKYPYTADRAQATAKHRMNQ